MLLNGPHPRPPPPKVNTVRFTAHTWVDQLAILSQTTVFVGTQGSAFFRFLFMPRGSAAVVIGSPDRAAGDVGNYPSFHELDRW